MAMIRIYHTDPKQTGGPLTADIPEDGLEHWGKYGWSDKPPDGLVTIDENDGPRGDGLEDAGSIQSAPIEPLSESPITSPGAEEPEIEGSTVLPLISPEISGFNEDLTAENVGNLNELTVKDLRELAKKNSIILSAGVNTKAEIIEAITKAVLAR
jgi:hypothetical protein